MLQELSRLALSLVTAQYLGVSSRCGTVLYQASPQVTFFVMVQTVRLTSETVLLGAQGHHTILVIRVVPIPPHCLQLTYRHTPTPMVTTQVALVTMVLTTTP
jgi:hypothetical protein